MRVSASDLHGAWQLVSWTYVHDDGRPDQHPLGADARGHIMYTPDGHVAALLMRGDRPPKAPATQSERASAYGESFGYTGRYSVRDGAVFHSIEVSTAANLVGFTSTRHIALDGDRLTLSGPDFAAGTARTQKIVWRRAAANAG